MIEWTETTHRNKPLDGKVHQSWEGRVGKMHNAVMIQGPITHNLAYRVMTLLRWKDAVHVDCESLEAAKEKAEELIAEWLSASGLKIENG